LRDVLLKTLAENGRHFTLLGPNETLTVVVTFRGSDKGSGVTGGMGGGILRGGGGSAAGGGSAPEIEARAVVAKRQAAVKALSGLGGAPAPNPTTARDYELLGDLVSKQGKFDEAVKAYQKAIELGADSKEQWAAMYRKLAQIYVQRAQDALAMEALQNAQKFIGSVKISPPKANPPAKTRATLPAQLVITIPRELSDRFGSGQITLDQFRRAAYVELRKFTAEK
jgi:hypothetical protein